MRAVNSAFLQHHRYDPKGWNAEGFSSDIALCDGSPAPVTLGSEPCSTPVSAKTCGSYSCFSPIKLVVCKVLTVDTVTPWQLMIWESAQAGNRASKTRCHLQWRDTEAQCQAALCGRCKVCHSARFATRAPAAISRSSIRVACAVHDVPCSWADDVVWRSRLALLMGC